VLWGRGLYWLSAVGSDPRRRAPFPRPCGSQRAPVGEGSGGSWSGPTGAQLAPTRPTSGSASVAAAVDSGTSEEDSSVAFDECVGLQPTESDAGVESLSDALGCGGRVPRSETNTLTCQVALPQ